jgi:hypothetical protein
MPFDRPIVSTSVLKVADRSVPSRTKASIRASVDRTRAASAVDADAWGAAVHTMTALRMAIPAAPGLLNLLWHARLV